MKPLLLRGGTLLDPQRGVQEYTDILLEKQRISKIGRELPVPSHGTVVDVAGKWVLPGVIDAHTHISEPNRLDRETIASLGRAAAAGGVTSVVVRPNDDLPLDNIALVEFLRSKAFQQTKTRIFPVSAATAQRQGKQLIDMGELAGAGVVAAGDDMRSVASAQIVRRAMEYARMFDLPYFSFPMDPSLAGRGMINEGYTSTMLGLAGSPASAEEVIVIRDIILARDAKCRLHISPVTTVASVELVRRAKADGISVTAETHPHYFILTEAACKSYDTNTKVDPPLRTEADVDAVCRGIKDGTIDIVASGHTPLSIIDKDLEFDIAVEGISGIEILLPLCISSLVKRGIVYPEQLANLLSHNPACMLGQPLLGRFEVGVAADITVVDPDMVKEVDPIAFKSRGRNTPFAGAPLAGWPVLTIAWGEIIMREGELTYTQ
jgi:dihydroorotase